MTADELDRCMRKYYKSVYALALCRCRNPADADDIAQDVFLKLYTYEGAFENDAKLRSWLLKCAANRSVNVLRSGWHRLSRPLEDAAEAVSPDISEPDGGTLLALIMKLNKHNRTALYLYYYERMTVEETARITGASVTAVRSRLARGRQQLRKLLESERN